MSDYAPLLTFIDQLRGRGVRTFRGPFAEAIIELELGPAPIQDTPAGRAEPVDLCNCKCKVYEHTNGLCLNGCEAEACAGPEVAN